MLLNSAARLAWALEVDCVGVEGSRVYAVEGQRCLWGDAATFPPLVVLVVSRSVEQAASIVYSVCAPGKLLGE